MKIFDTHCHPYLNSSKTWVIENFFQNWWTKMTIIWTDLETSKKAIDLARNNENIYATIWFHPCDVENLDLEKSIFELEKIYLENNEKIVAIWEIWLDYYWIDRDSEKFDWEEKQNYISKRKKEQKLFFEKQIDLAKKLDLPIVIHNRESKDDIFEILKQKNFKNFVFHCYSEDLDFAKKLLDFSSDCKISFSWIVTFKNALEIKETAKNIPLKNILAETDSPYLTPTPFRWKEENEPIFTKFVIEELAKIREENLEKFSLEIYKNSLDFFKIK